ncbi:outer membrane beta-barrel protein [Schleiferia thermophila]|jgi:hypothetical protein|uniref:Outer membrane protein with beta-barrel domain n=1 Tax=Schleiferia thermophila TaxID=884107 RepID=A0A368ZYF3_9FLAO|nr:outer membrane beta-barrel protein [Schleiferia thermophila]KFD38726.1 hypothetical protein AT05_08780 [Schleiferia thermophila str. Yellowstone]RCX02060.1 outer membrane protein with beta-barrel domain [Schleiferia thermophila]GCD80583.1 hypothetical protein JCM30197_18300 [Schleiferia thermophila]
MRKLSGISAFTMVLLCTLNAQNYYQQGFFLRAGNSYTFSMPYSLPFNQWENRTLTDSTASIQTQYFSPGSGLYAHLGFGYQVNDIFRFGLDIGYQYSSSSTVKDIYSTRIDTIDFSFESPRTLKSNALLFTPEITFMLPMEYITRPYLRVGFPILIGVLQEKNTVVLPSNNNFFDVIESHTNHVGRLTFGFSGAIGLEWVLSDNLFFFTEVRALGAHFTPKSSSLVKLEVNGVGELNQLAIYQKETVYERNLTFTTNDELVANQPTKASPFNLPFNHVGISAGLTIQLF